MSSVHLKYVNYVLFKMGKNMRNCKEQSSNRYFHTLCLGYFVSGDCLQPQGFSISLTPAEAKASLGLKKNISGNI